MANSIIGNIQKIAYQDVTGGVRVGWREYEHLYKLFFSCKRKMGKKLKKNFSLRKWTNEPSVESLGAWSSHYDLNTDEQWLNTLLLKPNEIWTKIRLVFKTENHVYTAVEGSEDLLS